MAESEGILGDGCKFAYSLDSPISWIELEGILEITLPKEVADKIEKTTHGTTGRRKYMGGLTDVSNCDVLLLGDLSNAVQRALFALRQARTTVYCRAEVPANREKTLFCGLEFQGYVEQWGPEAPIDDKQTLMVSWSFDSDYFILDTPSASEIS